MFCDCGILGSYCMCRCSGRLCSLQSPWFLQGCFQRQVKALQVASSKSCLQYHNSSSRSSNLSPNEPFSSKGGRVSKLWAYPEVKLYLPPGKGSTSHQTWSRPTGSCGFRKTGSSRKSGVGLFVWYRGERSVRSLRGSERRVPGAGGGGGSPGRDNWPL